MSLDHTLKDRWKEYLHSVGRDEPDYESTLWVVCITDGGGTWSELHQWEQSGVFINVRPVEYLNNAVPQNPEHSPPSAVYVITAIDRAPREVVRLFVEGGGIFPRVFLDPHPANHLVFVPTTSADAATVLGEFIVEQNPGIDSFTSEANSRWAPVDQRLPMHLRLEDGSAVTVEVTVQQIVDTIDGPEAEVFFEHPEGSHRTGHYPLNWLRQGTIGDPHGE